MAKSRYSSGFIIQYSVFWDKLNQNRFDREISCYIFTVLNDVEKVMFLHLSVYPQGGGYLGRYPPGPGIPPGPSTTPDQVPTLWDQVKAPETKYNHSPPSPNHLHPPDQVPHWDPGTTPQRRLLLRTVRILLECILVVLMNLEFSI